MNEVEETMAMLQDCLRNLGCGELSSVSMMEGEEVPKRLTMRNTPDSLDPTEGAVGAASCAWMRLRVVSSCDGCMYVKLNKTKVYVEGKA
jgi:hypothetical protein